MFFLPLVTLDGDYWTKGVARSTPSKDAVISQKELLDQKIITRLSCLSGFVNRMRCSDSNCNGVLVYAGLMPNAMRLKSRCGVCAKEELLATANLCSLKHDDDEKHRQVYDVPYQLAVASKLIPGGGAGTQARVNAIIGLSGLSDTALTDFYNGPLFSSFQAVYDKSVRDNLSRVIENALKRDPAADGVSKYYPVSMRVDCRWDKPWGWNALNATVRMIESTTNLVMATITFHRKASSDNRFESSAKSCDAEGSARCLREVTRLGFDVVEIIHDDDSSSMKRLVECKAQLAQQPEYAGKISSSITERLCVRYLPSLLLLIVRHAGKHVGEAINKLAVEAKKKLSKSKPKTPAVPKKGSKLADKKTFNAALVSYVEKKKAFEAAKLELRVLESNKSYNYFKKSWKASLIAADGDDNLAQKAINNVLVHLDANQECVECTWHSSEYSQSFGPFSSKEALSVIKLWCEKYAARDLLAKYTNTETTNYNEYVNSLEGFFNLKIKHCGSDRGYDGLALYVSALANLGPIVDKYVVIEVGLPWEATQERLLQKRIDVFRYHSERKTTEDYLSSRAIAKQDRKNDTSAGEKDQNYKSVVVAKENDKSYKRSIANDALLFSMDGSNTRKTRENYNEGEFVFVAFGKYWHYGAILSFEEEDLYKLHFLDNAVEILGSHQFRRANQMIDTDLVWIARKKNVDVHEKFGCFKAKLVKFNAELDSKPKMKKSKK